MRFEDRPLSKAQKLELVKLAEAAWLKRGQTAVFPTQDKAWIRKAQENWRREQAEIACGVWISGATQRHWLDLKAHFEALLGEAGAAFGTLMRAETNGARQARWKLSQALKQRGLQESYAAAIARAQFKRALDQLSEKQLWCLFYTVSKRRPAPAAGGSANFREISRKVVRPAPAAGGSDSGPPGPLGRAAAHEPATEDPSIPF